MAIVYWAHLPEHTDLFSQGYIGFTSGTLARRWAGHLVDAKRYPHITFYKAMKKYGDRVVVEVLVEGSNEYCLDIENKLRPDNKIGWNIKVGGELGSIGVIPSEESRQKMSEAHLGEKNHFYGRQHTEEAKSRMSQANKGRKASDEAKAKMSETRTGKKLSLSPEQRAKRSSNAQGRITSQETKDKISKARTGLKVSEASLLKLRAKRKENPWYNPRANKTVWFLAQEIKDYFDNGYSRDQAALLTFIDSIKLTTIWQKLKAGWSPQQDTHWSVFVLQHKETENVT